MTHLLRYLSLSATFFLSLTVSAQWTNENFAGSVVNFQPPTSGGSFLMNFKSKVNSGSDKAFLLFQDESSFLPGTNSEDVRFTIGVYNDFRSSSVHSDELWFQGGGRLVQNVGNWDSEYVSLIGQPGYGTTGGFEWRVNNVTKMVLNHNGKVGIGIESPGNYDLNVNGYLNVEQGARFGCTSCGNHTNLFGSYGWGILMIQGRVLSSSDNLHLSPANGKKVIINDSYRAAGGGGNGAAGLEVEGETWLASGSGVVGIGTTSIPSGYKLAVDGKAIMEEVKVEVSGNWPDYVFAADYPLKSLEETETFIKENKRLPDMPSAQEVAENGIMLGEMNRLLVEKVEESTLHLINLQKENAQVKTELSQRSIANSQVQLEVKVGELTLYNMEQFKRIDTQEELIRELIVRIDNLESK